MEITIEKIKLTNPSQEKTATEGGKTVKEAYAEGAVWLPVEFLRGMRIAWNWDDLLQDATTAEENLNLAMAGLVLSNNVEFAAQKGEL